jgi:hypothetical protein
MVVIKGVVADYRDRKHRTLAHEIVWNLDIHICMLFISS